MKKTFLQRYIEKMDQESERRKEAAMPLREKIRRLKLQVQSIPAYVPPAKPKPAPPAAIPPAPKQMPMQATKQPAKPKGISPQEALRQIRELLAKN